MNESETIASKLAFLYLKNQDLSNKTPEDLYDLYLEAFDMISARRKEQPSKKAKIIKKSELGL